MENDSIFVLELVKMEICTCSRDRLVEMWLVAVVAVSSQCQIGLFKEKKKGDLFSSQEYEVNSRRGYSQLV
jgi:hypothetical protein